VSSTNEATEQPEVVDIAVQLAEQLMRFHGCEAEKHEQISQQHRDNLAGHITLEEFTQRHSVLPDTLSTPHMLAPGHIHPSDAEKWKYAFLGTSEETPDAPAKVCLPCSSNEEAPTPPGVTYDIDSIMGFVPSLALAKQGIRFNLTPHVVSNLESDIHLTFPVSTGHGRTRQVPLHTIPHYLFGRLVGHEDITIYLFFPRLWEKSKMNNYLSQELLRRWTDRVLLPAIYSQASASTVQHYPGAYDHGALASKAGHTESHARKDKSGARHQYIHHFLQPEILAELWAIVLHTVEEQGLQDFQGVQIFFTAKNLKVLSKRPTLERMWSDYFLRWDQTIDNDYIDPDRVWIDIGKEVCARPSFLWYQDAGDQQAETYLWRPCCLETYWHWSLHGCSPKTKLRSVYQTALLRDAGGMTLLTSHGSPSWMQGLLYSQFYTSEKEIFDAAKTFPFRDGALESLALDAKIRASWQKAGGSENHRPETLNKSYLGSKARCAAGITSSVQKSFGTREEHRMTLRLARRVREHLQNSGDWSREVIETHGTEPFWRLRTAIYLGYVRANLNKFTTGFEYVRSLASHDYISWDYSQMMIMFLRLLKYGYASNQPRREIALWNDERVHTRTGEKLYGLGFSTTLARDGYCWLMPKIDWEQYTFLEELPGRSLFGNIHIVNTFTARWRAIREAKDDFVKVEQLGKWLKQYGTAPTVRKYIMWHMMWICVRHFRKDVLSSIQSSIRGEYRNEAAQGKTVLCKENLDRILQPNEGEEVGAYRLASGNKMAYKSLEGFIDFLWDFNDGRERKHWEERSYRVLQQRCVGLMETWCGKEWGEKLQVNIKDVFPLVNWVAPYPNHTVFWQHTKQHQRMWLSVYNRGLGLGVEEGEEIEWKELVGLQDGQEWIIGRNEKATLVGRPRDPDLVSEDLEEIKQSILRKWERYRDGERE
jgi:hypothetical protein